MKRTSSRADAKAKATDGGDSKMPGSTPARSQKTRPVRSTQHASDEHEALCTRCGKCCYQKFKMGKTVVITPFPCRFLDTQTNTCTVYDRRLELNPDCLTLDDGYRYGAFPADCGYNETMAPPDYRPAIDKWDWVAEWDVFDELAEDLQVPDEIRELIRVRGPHARPLYDEAYERIKSEREPTIAMQQPDAEAVEIPSLVALVKSNKHQRSRRKKT